MKFEPRQLLLGARRPDTVIFDSGFEFLIFLEIKWKLIKTVFRYTVDSPDPAIQSAYIKPQLPMMYDLSSDPHEDANLWYTNLTNAFLLAPVFRTIAEYERSVKEYPNIKVGEDFNGYKK